MTPCVHEQIVLCVCHQAKKALAQRCLCSTQPCRALYFDILAARECGPARCRELAGDARRVTGARFKLVSPVTKVFAGYLRVTLEWANVLQPVQLPAPRAPMPAPAAADARGEGACAAPLDEACLTDNEAIVEVSVNSAAVEVLSGLFVTVVRL